MVRIISQTKKAYLYSYVFVVTGFFIPLLFMLNNFNLLFYLAGVFFFLIFAGILAIPAYFISKKKIIDIDNESVRYYIGDELKVQFPLWKIFKIENKIRIRRYTSATHLIIWENNERPFLNLNDFEMELGKIKDVFRILMNYSVEFKFKIDNKLNWK